MPNERRSNDGRLSRIEQRLEDHQRSIDEVQRAKETYVPIIERNGQRLEELRTDMHELAQAVANLNRTLTTLSEKIGPILSERAIVLRAARFWGGIIVGIIAAVATKVIIDRWFG